MSFEGVPGSARNGPAAEGEAGELKAKILEYVRTSKKKVAARDVADGLGVEHRVAKKAIAELVNSGVLEFESFGGATFLKIGEA